jgi:hypothetical protein
MYYVWVNQKFYECIYCEVNGYNRELLILLDLDERIGKRFFKWVVKEIAREFDWEELYHEHYYERILTGWNNTDYSLDRMDQSFDVTLYFKRLRPFKYIHNI